MSACGPDADGVGLEVRALVANVDVIAPGLDVKASQRADHDITETAAITLQGEVAQRRVAIPSAVVLQRSHAIGSVVMAATIEIERLIARGGIITPRVFVE